MNKRGVSKIVVMVIIVSLILVSIITLSNIIKPLIERAATQLENNPLKKDIEAQKAKSPGSENTEIKEGCIPNWKCGEWSKCEIVYNLEDLIEEKILLEGKKQRACEDLDKCSYNKIEEEKCDTKAPVSVKKVIKCFKEYIEVRNEEGVLVSRVEITNGNSSQKLNIQLLLGDVEYCSYCYDGVRNYDEDEIDCVYKGESCPVC